MRNFEDNLSAKGIIIRYTASQKGVYLFHNPLNNFLHLQHVGRRQKTKTSADDAKKHIDWLIFFIETAIGPWLDQGLTGCHVNLNELSQRLMDKNSLFRQRCLNSPEYP